jgi:hypothetical protein
MAFFTHHTGLAKPVRPYVRTRSATPVRPTWGWALPLILMIVALMVPVVASLSLRALLFLPS